MTANVECTRCGHRWYAAALVDGDDIPEECPRCYREAVQPIPEEPSLLERQLLRFRAWLHTIPARIDEIEHELILWKENHRYLLDIATFVAAMLIIFSLLYIFIFVW
jgi:NAD-dependent SIR2 family protein deacetylase